MPNFLDTISSSLFTSATSANNSGGKADFSHSDALGGQFSGLLNQAFQGQQPETQSADQHNQAQKPNNQNQTVNSSSQNDHENQPSGTANQHQANSATHTGKHTDSTDQDKHQKTQATASPDDSHHTDKKTDKRKKDDQPDTQALQALILPQPDQQAQPLPATSITILQSAHLLGQQQPAALDTTNTENLPDDNTTADNTSAVTAATAGTNPIMAQVTSQLALIPGLAKGQSNNLAFALPTTVGQAATATTAGTAQASANLTEPTQANQVELPGQTDTPVSITPQPSTPATTNSNFPSPSLTPQASTEGLAAAAGNPASQPASPLGTPEQGKGGEQNIIQATITTGSTTKPNASLPTSMFQTPASNMADTLNTMNSEMASATVSGSATAGFSDSGSSNGNSHSSDSSDPSAINLADLLSANGVGNDALIGAITHGGNQSTEGIPQFTSPEQNPINQVADGTSYSVQNGHKELIIRLNPNNLGEVRVNLVSHGNQEVSAKLIASTQESHDLLKGQLDSLKSTLESQGVTVERLSVVLAGSAADAGNSTNSHHQHSSTQQDSQQQQQQNTQQQGAFQQQFNQQNQANNPLFNLLNGQGQSQAGFGSQRGNSTATGPDSITEGEVSSTPQPVSNDNGRISILA